MGKPLGGVLKQCSGKCSGEQGGEMNLYERRRSRHLLRQSKSNSGRRVAYALIQEPWMRFRAITWAWAVARGVLVTNRAFSLPPFSPGTPLEKIQNVKDGSDELRQQDVYSPDASHSPRHVQDSGGVIDLNPLGEISFFFLFV
jgi:hypothetical protein